jgi:rod shape-determining protein MreC
MTLISTIFSRNRRFFYFGLTAVAFLIIVFSPFHIRSTLADISATVFYYPFAELKNYVMELQGVAQENRRLKSELAEKSQQLSVLLEAKRENQRLREFLGFESREGFRVVPVKIVSLQQNIYPVAALINKGRKDSIKVDLPVVNRFGLVGRITEVMPDYSTVALLTDPSSSVSGRIADSRQFGIVRFSPARGMFLDNLPADADVSPGDLIITSGLGGIYPAGLSVAIVDSVSAGKGDIMKTVLLKPTVDFFEIDELYVLTSDIK